MANRSFQICQGWLKNAFPILSIRREEEEGGGDELGAVSSRAAFRKGEASQSTHTHRYQQHHTPLLPRMNPGISVDSSPESSPANYATDHPLTEPETTPTKNPLSQE